MCLKTVTATQICGLPADNNGYPDLQQYYNKYKYLTDNRDSEMRVMEEAKSKLENEYPQGVSSNEQYNEETNFLSDNGNIDAFNGELPSNLREDYGEDKNKDFQQSGDIYPTQSVSEEGVTLMKSEDFDQEEGNTSSVTQASPEVESIPHDEEENENGDDNFPDTLHVEGVYDDGNQSSNDLNDYLNDTAIENHLEATPEPGLDHNMTTASDDLTNDRNETREQYEGLDDDSYQSSNDLDGYQEDPAKETRSEVTPEPELDHNMITESDDLSKEGNETSDQNSENEFGNQRYLEEQDEFTAVFDDEKEETTNETEASEESLTYNITDDSVETQTYSNEYDDDSTTPSEFILSQTEVEVSNNTLDVGQTTAETALDDDVTDSGEISDQEEITQRNFVGDDEYEEEGNSYEDNTDEDDYDDDEYEEDVNDSEKYEESTWQNEEETADSSPRNDDYEDIVEELQNSEEEFRENILKSLTTDAPVGPRYKSSIVPMILLALLIVGMLFLCTRAPAYCYNLFRIVKGVDPFRRRLEKKGYMVLPMGDKSV